MPSGDAAPRLTVLISARKNSKYLAKFILGMWRRTKLPGLMEVLVIMNEHDTWNDDLVLFFEEEVLEGLSQLQVVFVRENLRLGRAGLHEYFNMLLPAAHGEWIAYFCEDHYITEPEWDQRFYEYVTGVKRSGDSEGKQFPLDPDEIWVLIPKFDNAGAMNHIVSRGFVRALGGKIGQHGWIDSYINDLMRDFPERVIRIDEEWFHDFTHDQPSPMSDAHMQGEISPRGKTLPAYDSSVTRHRLALDAEAIKRSLERGERS